MRQLIIMGGGGDGLVVAEAIRQCTAAGHSVQLAGFLDDVLQPGTTLDGACVFGRLDDWANAPADALFVPAIQKVRDMPRRASRIDHLAIPADRWGRIVHPTAVVASTVRLGVGIYLAAHVTIQPGCVIGDFATVRASAAVGHDATIERHGYAGPNSTMCGRTVLCEGAHLGPNAVILDARRVGRFAVVGIGTGVTKNVPDFAVMMGNPAKRVGQVSSHPTHKVVQSVERERDDERNSK